MNNKNNTVAYTIRHTLKTYRYIAYNDDKTKTNDKLVNGASMSRGVPVHLPFLLVRYRLSLNG